MIIVMPYYRGQQVGVRLGVRQVAIMTRITEKNPQKKPAEVLREALECLAIKYGVQEGLPL